MDIQIEEWLNHPITKQLFDVVDKEKKELTHMVVSGYAEKNTCEATGLEYTKLVNRIEGLKILERFRYDIGGE